MNTQLSVITNINKQLCIVQKKKEFEEQEQLNKKEEKAKNNKEKITNSKTTPNNSIDENLIISKNLINNKKVVKVSDKALKYTPKRPVSAEHGDKVT